MLFKILFIIIVILLIDSSESFLCTTQGRFQNVYDPTCKTYYLCDKSLGKLTPTLYKCPNTFDPNLNECSNDYVCQLESHCVSSGYIPDLSDQTCIRYYNCFSFFGFYLPFTYSCAPGYQFDPVKKHCSSTYKCEDYLLAPQEKITPITTPNPIINEEFICTETGMFPDQSDKNCSGYFYCVPIGDGKYVKRIYKCPKYFNPQLKLCTENYACPYNQDEINLETSTNQNIESATVSTKTTIMEDTTKTEFVDFTESTTEVFIGPDTTNSDSNDEVLTETTNIIEESTTLYQVNDETTFDSVETKPEIEVTTIGPDSSIENEIMTENIEITTQKEEIITKIYEENLGETTSGNEKEPGTEFENTKNPEIDITTIGLLSSVKTEMTTEKIEITTQKEFTAIMDGGNLAEATTSYNEEESGTEYENTNHLESTTNFETIETVTNLIETEYSLFTQINEETETITSETISDRIETESISLSLENTTHLPIKETTKSIDITTQSETEPDTIQETTEKALTSIMVTSQSPEEFHCEATGRYPDTSDEFCSQYFLCTKLHSGGFVKTPYKCPGGTSFDPQELTCSKTYQCSYISTSENINSTTIFTTQEIFTTENVNNEGTTIISTTTTRKPVEFICTSTGKFPNLIDQSCISYFLCSKRQNGTFVKTLYNCQGGSTFDPDLKRCSKEHQCFSQQLETTTTIPQWEFSCSKVGRFKNENDSRCKSYFLCSQFRNGTFVRTQYDCPNTSIFNGVKHICSDVISSHFY